MKLYWFAAAVVLPLQAQITAEQTEFFEKKIRPVLAEKCYGCHGPESKPPAGGLRIHTRDGVRKGGDSGPAGSAKDGWRVALLFVPTESN